VGRCEWECCGGLVLGIVVGIPCCISGLGASCMYRPVLVSRLMLNGQVDSDYLLLMEGGSGFC